MFSQVIMLYNSNLYRAICKLYLIKVGKIKTIITAKLHKFFLPACRRMSTNVLNFFVTTVKVIILIWIYPVVFQVIFFQPKSRFIKMGQKLNGRG